MQLVKAADVLDFWFSRSKDWFAKSPEFDEEIRARFLALHEAAASGELEFWKQDHLGCLALVIALDQFPRNLFRDRARAFATDEMARATARSLLRRGWDQRLTKDERLFAYLPFEHSEALADQELCCELMKPLGPELLQYAERHREIIQRFGRFPHRNAALGRDSTPDEVAFLKEPGSSF